MKNRIKLVSIIVFAMVIGLLFSGCGEKGGTLEVKNETGMEIYGFAIPGNYTQVQIKEIEEEDIVRRARETIYPDESYIWTFTKNGDVTWGYFVDNVLIYGGVKKLEKSSEETVTATK